MCYGQTKSNNRSGQAVPTTTNKNKRRKKNNIYYMYGGMLRLLKEARRKAREDVILQKTTTTDAVSQSAYWRSGYHPSNSPTPMLLEHRELPTNSRQAGL